MKSPKNILLIRLKSMGDILFTLPAIYAVRENFPTAHITFLTSKEYAPLLRGFSHVDRIIALDRDATQNFFRAPAEILKLLRQLRAGKFSLVVDFQGYGETAWLSWWSGAGDRWGNVYGPGREWLYTHGIKQDRGIHHASWNLSLLEHCGLAAHAIKNEFILPDDALIEARKFFTENRLVEKRPTLFIQPFTSSPRKNWLMENFIALAKHFKSRGMQIIFGGGPSERTLLEPARVEGFPISAGLPLLVNAALVKLSTLTVGGDTGLLHLAVAMDKRVLMLMTAIGQTYPFQHANWILTPAKGVNVSTIKVQAVIEASEKVFD